MRGLIAFVLLIAGLAVAAPAPTPLTINSRADTAPQVLAYRASAKVFDLTFVDGTNKSDISGHTVWMSWSTNATAATCATATCAIVSGSNGTARATFTASNMNYAAGTYIYEVGVTTGSTLSVYRQGVLQIRGSPYAGGASNINWSTNVAWGTFTPIGWPYLSDSNAFATAAQGVAATNAQTRAAALETFLTTNTVRGTLNGTNGVYWVDGSYTNWFLFYKAP